MCSWSCFSFWIAVGFMFPRCKAWLVVHIWGVGRCGFLGLHTTAGILMHCVLVINCDCISNTDGVSVTELAREQPLDGGLTNTKSNNASVTVSAANSGVLPSPDVLNSLDMIHSWLQQSERQADTDSSQMMSVSLTHTSTLPSVMATNTQSKQLPLSMSSWHTAAVNVNTVRHFILYTFSSRFLCLDYAHHI